MNIILGMRNQNGYINHSSKFFYIPNTVFQISGNYLLPKSLCGRGGMQNINIHHYSAIAASSKQHPYSIIMKATFKVIITYTKHMLQYERIPFSNSDLTEMFIKV